MTRPPLRPTQPPGPSARELIGTLTSGPRPPAFALLRRASPATGRPGPVELLLGTVTRVERIADIPLSPDGEGPSALALVPFRQIGERGYACHDDATPLQVLAVEESHTLDPAEVLDALPQARAALGDAAFDLDDDAYADVVRRIIREEIAPGAGANFVIRRDFTARIDGFGPAEALTLFRRLLTAEAGAYWTFCVHTGPEESGGDGRTLIGASPEAHVRVRGGQVVMNPISGTYRYPPGGPDAESLLAFLGDPKERDELSMVVDEELKMLCSVADRDIHVRGPYLREMAHLAHTEFEIRGHGARDAREVLRRTMFAATVTGSPLESACRVIRRYEPSGRGYYAGALALFGRDAEGTPWLDSPILIRTADISARGELRVSVGATLVRDSDPRSEVAETHAKLAGVLGALGVADRPAPGSGSGTGSGTGSEPPAASLRTPEVLAALAGRRGNLAPFWLDPARCAPGDRAGRRGTPEEVLLIDAEDDFTAMLAHVLRSAGLLTRVRPYDDPGLGRALDAHRGAVLLGPGPGDPNSGTDARIGALRSLAAELLGRARAGGGPLVGVCLGFQLMSAALGLPVRRSERPFQGAQRTVTLFREPVTAGFYNSFSVRAGAERAAALLAEGVELSRHPATREVTAVRGPGFAGVQFHPESVLSLSGPRTLRWLLGEARRTRPGAAAPQGAAAR
ncbi:anthranilate synthase family protein [Streptomyces sp. NPDC020141]|uniref:anthranilate synthase family protein n=1 Tax=Streptomyces sp. NPDC020141 TaxID=3365065 RepID=UPI0037B5783B